MTDRFLRFRPLAASAAALALALAGAAHAESAERHVVRHRIAIACEEGDADCEPLREIHLEAGDGHGGPHFWFSGDDDEPVRIRLGDHQAFFLGGLGGGYLGVGLTELTPELRAHFGVPEEAGVLISKVAEDSPAAIAGLAVGDIVTAVDGEPVASGRELASRIRAKGDGESATLEVWRDGSVDQRTAVLEERQGGLAHRLGSRRILCDDGDCTGSIGALALGDLCGDDGEPCRVEVRCEDGGCDCRVDGESTDCGELHRE